MSPTNNGQRSLTISISGFWLIGWLFTIGLAELDFWRGLLALLLWPYYIGVTIGTFSQ